MAVFKRWMYRGKRPHWLARVLNRAWEVVHSSGLFGGWVTLEVVGRKSGRVVTLPVVLAPVGGQRYLVSMLGDDAQWVLAACCQAAEDDPLRRVIFFQRGQEIPGRRQPEDHLAALVMKRSHHGADMCPSPQGLGREMHLTGTAAGWTIGAVVASQTDDKRLVGRCDDLHVWSAATPCSTTGRWRVPADG